VSDRKRVHWAIIGDTLIICVLSPGEIVEMAMRINPPELKNKAYDRYKQELSARKEITELPQNKQGMAIALTLAEEDDPGIRENIFDEMTLDGLKDADGLKKLITFMDSKLGKDGLTSLIRDLNFG